MMESVRPLPVTTPSARDAGSAEKRMAESARRGAEACHQRGWACAPRPAPRRRSSSTHRRSTGLASGDWGSFGNPGDVPGDQRLDSFGSLEFDAEPLASASGDPGQRPGRFSSLAADRPNAFVAVRLIDVAPDGSAASVARGFLNLTHRQSREAPTPLDPGKRYRVEVQLTGTAYAFPAGHRVRLAVSRPIGPSSGRRPNLLH